MDNLIKAHTHKKILKKKKNRKLLKNKKGFNNPQKHSQKQKKNRTIVFNLIVF